MAGRSLSRQTLEVGAQYANRVRWDLRGGCSAMGIPTAITGYFLTNAINHNSRAWLNG